MLQTSHKIISSSDPFVSIFTSLNTAGLLTNILLMLQTSHKIISSSDPFVSIFTSLNTAGTFHLNTCHSPLAFCAYIGRLSHSLHNSDEIIDMLILVILIGTVNELKVTRRFERISKTTFRSKSQSSLM